MHLAGDVVVMMLKHWIHFAPCEHNDIDVIIHFKACLLAHILYTIDKLTRQSFFDELLRERNI